MSHSNDVVNTNDEINWTEVIKKEARGTNDTDFGEVQEIVYHYILTEKGIINKEKFFLPTDLVIGFDGDKLRFNISEEEAKEKFQRDTAPSAEEYAVYKKKEITHDIDTDKQQNKKNIINSLNPDVSLSKNEDNIGNSNLEIPQAIEDGLSVQSKKSKIKNEAENKEVEERIRREFEDKAKMEAERKAQSITQQVKTKPRWKLKEKHSQ